MTGCRDMDKKRQKCFPPLVTPHMDKKRQKCFPPLVTPPDFFQKSGSVTFVPLWCPNFMQKKTSIQWTPDISISATTTKILVKNDFLSTKSKKFYGKSFFSENNLGKNKIWEKYFWKKNFLERIWKNFFKKNFEIFFNLK